MSLTYEQANDEMLALVQAAFATLPSGKIYYESVSGDRSTGNEAFFQVFVRHRTGRQAAFPSADNRRMFRRDGDITIQCFGLVGRGLSASYANAKVFADAFEGKATPGGIWFRNVRMTEIGRDGNFHQINVIAEFIYDEIK